MLTLSETLEYFNKQTNIPVFLFEDNVLTEYYTASLYSYSLIIIEIAKAIPSDKILSYYNDQEHNLFYGSIRVESNPKQLVIIGSVSSLPITKNQILKILKKYTSDAPLSPLLKYIETDLIYMERIPFIKLLSLLNYFINHADLEKSEYELANLYLKSRALPLLKSTIYSQKEDGLQPISGTGTDTDSDTKKFFTLVKDGLDLDFFKAARNYVPKVSRVRASNPLRGAKNDFIYGMTKYEDLFIEKGMPDYEANALVDMYMRRIETFNTISEVYKFYSQTLHDFNRLIATLKKETELSGDLAPCIKYIEYNTNKAISISTLAEIFGYNRSYLSRKFKNIYGISISHYIIQCKLKEAANLLIYTDKSLGEIAEYLTFSSQSHFCRAFKSYYNVTPHQYRNNNH